MAPYGPHIAVSMNNGIALVTLQDSELLEEHIISEVSEALFSVITDMSPPRIILDFARVRHLSSSTLGMLIRVNKAIDEAGGALSLCHIAENLYEIFIITKLNKLFDIHDHAPEAIASFAQA